jgi:hypothetical protein
MNFEILINLLMNNEFEKKSIKKDLKKQLVLTCQTHYPGHKTIITP